MKLIAILIALSSGLLAPVHSAGQTPAPPPPATDRRLVEVRDLNKTYTFPEYKTKEEWLERADHLRTQILSSAGLLPMPAKTALNPRIFGRIDREGYSVEKVYFESHPGFFVTGNLYRPRGKSGPYPAVLSPHGHWTHGRLENTDVCSIPGRAINLALQGCVVLTYDMIGYNDSTQLTHTFGGAREELWGISLSGLQLWNSIRAVDFLCSLPEVDQNRIAATGESGGGTQTFLLMAIDERIKVGAPVNMVSAHMQGGCLCENAPGLRIDTFNVELAALAAPRPLLLISATGDWTRNTLTVEYPAIERIYKLFDALDRVIAAPMNAPHNYNKQSREEMYSWFRWWLGNSLYSRSPDEKPFRAESLTDSLVFYGIERPSKAVSGEQLRDYLIGDARSRLASLKPQDNASLKEFSKLMSPALTHALAAKMPAGADLTTSPVEKSKKRDVTTERFYLGRRGVGDRIPATLWMPSRASADGSAVLIVSEQGRFGKEPDEIVRLLLRSGRTVLSIDCFQTGAAKGPPAQEVKYFTTYNRTDLANRVQDIITAVAYLRSKEEVLRVDLIGEGRAGLWCLLARGLVPEIGRAVVDVDQFDNTSDEAFLKDMFTPGIRRAGDFRTAAALAVPSRLLIHNSGEKFETAWIEDVYKSLGRAGALEVRREKLPTSRIAEWIGR